MCPSKTIWNTEWTKKYFFVLFDYIMYMKGSRSPDFGAVSRPILNAKKYVFPNSRQTIPNLTKKKYWGGGGGVLHLYFIYYKYRIYCYIFTISQNNRKQSHLLLSLTFLIVHYGKFNNWNQSSNRNVIHKDDVKFLNFSQNTANFPNSMGPCPIPKKGCESPDMVRVFPSFV